MSRTNRFLGGLGFGYFNQAVVVLAGLWLTPFLLRNVGVADYGLWLVGTQMIGYLLLLDFGIVQLLPREVAYVTGRVDSPTDMAKLIGDATRIVLLQTPVVAIAGFILWWTIPTKWEPLRHPLGIILTVFVALFPLRIMPAVLLGLQDLSFLGMTQFCAWTANIAVTVLLVRRGWKLEAMTAGWIAGQVATTIFTAYRLLTRFSLLLPHRRSTLEWARAGTYLRQGFWVSVAQIAQSLVGGTDLVIITSLMGPSAAVVYSCTGKLISVLANQPQLLMQAAAPALCQLKASGSRERLRDVSISLNRVMMSLSGLVVCVALVANQWFVSWWVGSNTYGGFLLNVMLLTAMICRHWNVTLAYSLFCYGFEKRVSITTLLDGVVTVATSAVAVKLMGAPGAPLGSVCGVCLVSIPAHLVAIGRVMQLSAWETISSLYSWFWRFLIVAFIAAALGQNPAIGGSILSLAAAAFMGIIYLALLAPLFLRPPLSFYTVPRVNWVWRKLTGNMLIREEVHTAAL
jgi:O-antigen/teichoic acid export membrane protein